MRAALLLKRMHRLKPVNDDHLLFTRDAIVLAQRLPALPEEGDMAVDRMSVQDPFSGLVFEIAKYAQYRQMQYEISCAWGVKMAKAENAALLLG